MNTFIFLIISIAENVLANINICWSSNICDCFKYFFLTKVCKKNSKTYDAFNNNQNNRNEDCTETEFDDDITAIVIFKPCSIKCLQNIY